MENIMGFIQDELFVLSIGMNIATFLLNTERVLKAIMLCKECLILFINKALEKKTRTCKFISHKNICYNGERVSPYL